MNDIQINVQASELILVCVAWGLVGWMIGIIASHVWFAMFDSIRRLIYRVQLFFQSRE